MGLGKETPTKAKNIDNPEKEVIKSRANLY